MKHFIRLDELICQDNRLTFKFSTSLNVFKKKSFFVEYDKTIQDPRPSINAIPFGAIMAPVAWATGAELILPELDKEYAESLERCAGHFKKWFSRKWLFGTQMDFKPVQNSFSPTRHAMLFSSGLDSLTTYIRHKDKNPVLFTVFGADIPLSHGSFITSYKEKLNDFAAKENISIQFIHTDACELWDLKRLKTYSKNWYGEIAHGLMLSSLVAPVAYGSVKTLMLASCSHRDGCTYTCGSEKGLVEDIRWAGTNVVNDNHELNRTEKIRVYLRPNERYFSQLRVCWMQFKTLNCGTCEKCSRTICELLANNIDPALCNFKMTADTLPRLKRRILKEFYIFFKGENALDFWRTIQETVLPGAVEDRYGARKFFEWFSGFGKIKKRQSAFLVRWFNFPIGVKAQAGRWLKPLIVGTKT